jgi:hypothetical protein
MFKLALGFSDYMTAEDVSAWRSLLPHDCYLQKGDTGIFSDRLETWLSVGDEPLIIGGIKRQSFSLKLNTALRWGNDAVKLLARLHGQCEIHAYVEPENRAWLADIIERGRKLNVLRPDQGWESVITMLRRRGDEPVVTSYSVCDGFPNPYIAGVSGDDEDAAERWWKQPAEERWAQAMSALRPRHDGSLEMTPRDWDDYHFGHGLDASDVVQALADAFVAK